MLKVLLFPEDSEPVFDLAQVSPKEERWVDIQPGRFFEREDLLTLSTLQATDSGKGYRPAAWLRSFLRRHPDLHFGVEAENVVYGGIGSYSNVGYSDRALDLFHGGTSWSQFVDDNCAFRPISIATDLSHM